MKKQIKNNVYWVGKTDWELKHFHGDEFYTDKGSTYNSYLICEDKIALIDTVWKPFSGEFVKNLSADIDLKKIDFVIVNHGETDHSGALPELMEKVSQNTPVYCTENAVKSLKGHYHKDWNFKIVKTGDRLSLGSKELIFIQAPMLHWPDTMFCYLTGDNILFSSDAFGQHFCTEKLFYDRDHSQEVWNQALKYYANILTPFSSLVTKKIDEFTALNLPLDIICPSHGVIWKDDPMQIVKKYQEWAANYQENQISIIYDTMWNGTRKLAENIAPGIISYDPAVNVKLFNTATHDKNEIITEIFKSKGILLGSPTVNKGILHSVAGILEMIRAMSFKNKKAAAFGCYGWYSESVDIMNNRLKEYGFEIISNGLRINWHADDAGLASAFAFGKEVGEKMK